MAKTRQATRNTEVTALELDKILSVDGQLYNINANKATKVDNQITINEHLADDEVNTKNFNGSDEVTIDIVPAAGGEFKGPIGVPTLTEAELQDVNGNTVINKSNISSFITTLTGSGWYRWAVDDSGEKKFETVKANGDVSQHLGIVVGNESDIDLFVTYNNNGPEAERSYLPLYIYLCENTGNIFYGTIGGEKAIQLSTDSHKLISPTSATSFTADELAQKFTEIDLNVATLSGGTSMSLQSLEGRMATAESNISTAQTNINTNTANITKITNGTTKVPSAAAADTATSATSATKATQDSNGTHIRNNYYRSASNSTNANTITISTSGPSGGNDGDIWIVYKA